MISRVGSKIFASSIEIGFCGFTSTLLFRLLFFFFFFGSSGRRMPKKNIGIRLPDEPKKKKKKRKGKKKVKKNPTKPISIDDAKIFEPTLESIYGKGKVINDLRKSAANADAVYLAGDPDREGEAISAHLRMVLTKPSKYEEAEPSGNGRFGKNGNGNGKDEKAEAEAAEAAKGKAGKGKKGKAGKKEDKDEIEVPAIDPKKIFRVTFNEITPKAIRAAFEKPRQVDTNLVDAQQAGRGLDRIVGYKISPLLWNKVRRGLSAGRVQTVALRLIVEREQEIRAFLPVEYWSIHAMLDGGAPPLFEAKLSRYKGEEIAVGSKEDADKIVAAVTKAKWEVANVPQKEKPRNPPPPFTTSKWQQAAYNRLRYTAKRTMALAQRLYEGDR